MKTKFELLDGALELFGLTPKEVVDYLSPKIEMPTIIPSKKFVTPLHIEAGMFHYAEENLIFPEIIPELIIDSVIGFWDTNEGIALCRDQEEMPWSSDCLEVDNKDVKSGFKATQMILDTVRKTGKEAEAAEYCAEYAKYSIKAGQAFLFSKFEAEKVLPQICKINEAFKLLKAKSLPFSLWLSSEYSPNCSCILCTNDGAAQSRMVSGNFKNNYNYVRPALRVKR